MYFVSPKLRFLLKSSGAKNLRLAEHTSIPRILWQTNFTDRVTLPVYLNYLFNRLMAPTFIYQFMITEEREKFILKNYPGRIYDAYSRIQIGAAQADFWRILVLQKYGGVYMDIDAHLVWPLERILKPEQEELFLQ